MKHLIFVVVAMNMAFSAHAAKWQRLKAEKSVFAELFEKVELYETAHQFVSKKESEDMTQSLEQLTYLVRHDWGGWSMPEDAYVGYAGDNPDFNFLREDDTRQEPAPVEDSTIEALEAFVKANKTDVYFGNDGNSFGDCANVFLHHLESNQVAVLSVCYSE